MGTPADVIKTRIMNNPTVYKGVIDCFITAVNMRSCYLFAYISKLKVESADHPYLHLAMCMRTHFLLNAFCPMF